MIRSPPVTAITEAIISHTVVLIQDIVNIDATIISVRQTDIFLPIIGEITALAKKVTAFKKQFQLRTVRFLRTVL